MKLKVLALVLTLTLILAVPALSEMIYSGSVTGGYTVSVLSPFGAIIDSIEARVGDRIEKGDLVATFDTLKVYAPCEGSVSGVFGSEGDSTEGVTERYGAVMYVEPVNKYTITATTEKAYNLSENKFIHIGEKVYLCCTADGTHQGTGLVTGIADDGKYTIEVNAGEFCMEETVGIFRQSDYASVSRIGRGTVAATKAVGVKGSGSILKLHVHNGDMVERGQLLFETVEGELDGMFAPGGSVVSDVSGIISAVEGTAGASVTKGANIATVYPDDSIQVEIPVLESELSSIYVGMPVVIEFSWDMELETRFDGKVSHISYINSAESGSEPSYTAIVSFTPDSSVRLGMSVLVYTQDETPVEPGPETDTAVPTDDDTASE